MIEPKSQATKKPVWTRNRVLVVAGLLIVAALVFLVLRPKPTPAQQLRIDMNGLQRAVENTSPRDVLFYVADDFKWNDTDREGLSKLLKGVFLEASKIEATRQNETYTIKGDSATVSGTFNARYRRIRESRDAPMNKLDGEYSIQWQFRDDNWKIVGATGGDQSPGTAPSESLF